jgi:hypothetical protein
MPLLPPVPKVFPLEADIRPCTGIPVSSKGVVIAAKLMASLIAVDSSQIGDGGKGLD